MNHFSCFWKHVALLMWPRRIVVRIKAIRESISGDINIDVNANTRAYERRRKVLRVARAVGKIRVLGAGIPITANFETWIHPFADLIWDSFQSLEMLLLRGSNHAHRTNSNRIVRPQRERFTGIMPKMECQGRIVKRLYLTRCPVRRHVVHLDHSTSNGPKTRAVRVLLRTVQIWCALVNKDAIVPVTNGD